MNKRILAPVLIAIGLVFGCQKAEMPLLEQEEPVVELQNGDIIPGQYIVVFKASPGLKSTITGTFDERVNAMRMQSEDLFQEVGIVRDAILRAYSGTIYGVTAKLNDEEVEVLASDERIAYLESDRYIVLGPPPGVGPPGGGDGGSTTQETPWGITRVGGAVTYTGSKKAWVIDTGIDLDHPDLNVNTSLSKTFAARTKNADDQNGHGTHVAGTIAAIDNDFGVVGVAAGAQVVAVRVLDRRGSGSISDVIAGVDYVGSAASAGDVANMSLGGSASQSLDDAVLNTSNKGVWFSIAAGNDGKDANNYSPARVNGTYIYTISAMDNTDTFASWSNWGNPPVDWCAPGVSIKSTWKDGGYNTISGTSMAAPHAAGVRLLGTPKTDGYVKNDPDGNPDPIIHR